MHIIVGLKSHGAELMLERLIEFSPTTIPNIVVVSLTSLDAIGARLCAQGVNVQTLNMNTVWSFPIALWQLARLIRKYSPDIIQTWMYHADLLGGLSALLAGNRNIVWGIRRTSISFSELKRTWFVMKICSLLSSWVPRKIICVADAARQSHIAHGYSADRMIVIHNGFDFSRIGATLDQRLQLRAACHFTEGETVIGTVGRFHPDKGHLNFIKAAAIVACNQSAVRFLLVGSGCDPSNQSLMSKLNDYDLSDRFVLLGERNDVPICLAAMDVFCMPSRSEGFPNALGEAMAMGLPCVATSVGDTIALVGDSAKLVPAEDEKALGQGLLEVLALPKEQRDRMALLAKSRVTTEFSIEKAHERFNMVYQKLLAEDNAEHL
jgi:glycosyltransferase involved in cell wall biosynthesis